jgi:hypothetical protein
MWKNENDFWISVWDIDEDEEGNNEIDEEFDPSPGTGMLYENPSFVNPDEGDFHLQEDSPCIDTGDPKSLEDPDGTRADMGAFYFDQRIRVELTIDMPSGWEIISLSVSPEDNDPSVILQELVNNDNLLLFKDAS